MGEHYPDPLTPEEIAQFFPAVRPPLAAGNYEVGLALGGTVSAGAYTAGVLDYIFEALDAWTRAREDQDPNDEHRPAPTHNVILSTIAGASGGAINGAIATRVAGWSFPHGPVAGNPFYDLWVDGVNLAKLLDPKEPNAKGLSGLFNTQAFSVLAQNLIVQTGTLLGGDATSPRHRSYLGDPLRLSMMVADVTGVPYRIGFRGQSRLGHDLGAHADYMRFALTVPGGAANGLANRPDEFALSSASPLNWDSLKDAALATSAFPAAFPSRALKRPLAMLGYRVVTVPGERPWTTELAQLNPQWAMMDEDGATPGSYRTVNVDGGTFNNEPLDHVRVALAGYAGRNPRGGDQADRGLVLVDPFSDPEDITLFDPPGLLDLIGPLLNAMIAQARFKPEDLALATAYDTYSRFLVAPWGPGSDSVPKPGSSAIASGGLGGFLGFVDRRFLDYDFRLGRRNAYDFLRTEFLLPVSNPLFADGRWTTAQMNDHVSSDTSPTGNVESFLPIIPLMKALRDNPPLLAEWPKLAQAPSGLADQVQARLDAIYTNLKTAASWWPGGVGGFAADAAWKVFLRGTLRDAFVGKVTDALKSQGLL